MSTTVGDELLRGICLYPNALDRRLIYADWLEENNKSDRADFIRLQIELEPIRADTRVNNHLPDRSSLLKRERQLLEKNAAEWLSPLGLGEVGGYDLLSMEFFLENDGEISIVEFRRGFVERIRCTPEAWLEFGRLIVMTTPVQVIRWSTNQLTDVPTLRVLENVLRLAHTNLSGQSSTDVALLATKLAAGLIVACPICQNRHPSVCHFCAGQGWVVNDAENLPLPKN